MKHIDKGTFTEIHTAVEDLILGNNELAYERLNKIIGDKEINFSLCCTQLKELDSDNFEDWIIVNGYSVFDDYYLKNDVAFSESDLIEIYNKEVMSL